MNEDMQNNKMWKCLLWIGLGLLIGIIVMRCFKGSSHSSQASGECRDTVRDTVRIARPEVAGGRIVRHDTVQGGKEIQFVYAGKRTDRGRTSGEPGRQPSEISDSGGLEQAIIPISQQVYRDSDYTAFVSGYHVALDSLKIVRTNVTVTKTVVKYKHRHWGIGVQGGYGWTTKGMLPYIGVGVSWSPW